MKKLILLALLGIFSIPIFAQMNGKSVGEGVIWTDSIKYSTSVADSSWKINLNFANEWYRIFIKGNANSPVDSVNARLGSITYNEAGRAVDTVWGSWAALKDSSWSDVNTIVNNTVGKDYLLFAPTVQLLELRLLNHRATLPTRVATLTINAVKKK